MSIEVQWPDGKYSLPQAISGCPQGWSSGWRLQDNEDDDNGNSHEPFDLDLYMKIVLGRNYKTYYCTKTFDGNSGFFWPRGKYCIAQYGGSCPSGFYKGSIYWDDEDGDDSCNAYQNPVPDGKYDGNTKIQYCCRSDGDPGEGMLLPTTEDFFLYRYDGVCQKVLGINDPVQFKLYFDDEDDDNDDSCSGNHPDSDCGGNHDIYFCYYSQSDVLDAADVIRNVIDDIFGHGL